MSHYHELTSEKYWNDSVQKEIKELQREKNRLAIRSFVQFLLAIAVFSMTVFAVQQMPNWLPALTSWMEQIGLIQALGSHSA